MTSDDSEARRPGPSHRLSLSRTPQPARASERRRRPQPLLKQRMPSGRGAMDQPNITSGGAGVLTPRFWVMVVLTGIAAGLLGALMMAILFNVQYAAFGYHAGSLEHGAAQASAARRVASLLIAGVFGGVAWFLLRRYTRGEPSEIDEAVWDGDGRLSFRRCLGTSVISEIVIGMGASIGREAAPKLLGGASGSVLAGWGGLSAQQRRLLVACGGGAGLAAVYNVPLAGALFTAEILIGSISLPVMLPAIACSAIATATAWIYLPDHAVYPGIPDYRFTCSPQDEELSRAYVFNIAMLAGRLTGITHWLRGQPVAATLPFGYFGASTGAAAALWAAAASPRPPVAAVVSRGGRPDLVGRRLALVQVPTLLIVGGADEVVLGLNRQAQEKLTCENRLAVIPDATHLFEEPGALEQVADLAGDWFIRHFTPVSPQ